MPTVDYVILPHLKKKDGSNFIRMRITHQRKSKYLKTSIAVEPSDLTRSGSLKHKGKEDLAVAERKKIRDIISEIPMYSLKAMSVDDVVRHVEGELAQEEAFRLDFIAFGMDQASRMKESTGKAYRTALNAWARYFERPTDISDITTKSLRGFEESLKKEGKHNAASQYLTLMASLYRRAMKLYNEPDLGLMRIPVDVFEYYDIPKKPAVEHRDISPDIIQMMIDQREGLEGMERTAVDAFLISFCLMGINAEDMYNATEPAKGGIIHYFRTKTTDNRDDKAEMYVRIEPCLEPIIRPYLAKNRLFNYADRYSKTNSMQHVVSKGLAKWIERNKLDDFTFYSARHTWATMTASKEADLDSNMVTEGLCHSGGNKMDKIYVRKDWEKLWDANAKVLSLLKWEKEGE